MADLGGPQISALLESVPGIANVLRSPVANALVNMIRAGARIDEFRVEDAKELVSYAVRRGLIGNDEGDRLLEDVRSAGAQRSARAAAKAKARKRAGPTRRAAKGTRKPVKARKAAARKAKPAKRPSKKKR